MFPFVPLLPKGVPKTRADTTHAMSFQHTSPCPVWKTLLGLEHILIWCLCPIGGSQRNSGCPGYHWVSAETSEAFSSLDTPSHWFLHDSAVMATGIPPRDQPSRWIYPGCQTWILSTVTSLIKGGAIIVSPNPRTQIEVGIKKNMAQTWYYVMGWGCGRWGQGVGERRNQSKEGGGEGEEKEKREWEKRTVLLPYCSSLSQSLVRISFSTQGGELRGDERGVMPRKNCSDSSHLLPQSLSLLFCI